MKAVTEPEQRDDHLAASPTGRGAELHEPRMQILDRGQRFFDKIYGKVSTRVMGQLHECGTEDLGILARLMYGYLLSNTSILSEKESSFCLIAGLIPQDVREYYVEEIEAGGRGLTGWQVNPQLKGHLKGALNNGATVAEISAVRQLVLRVCEDSGMRFLGPTEPATSGWRSRIAEL